MYFTLYHFLKNMSIVDWVVLHFFFIKESSWWCLQSTAWWNRLLFLRGFSSLDAMIIIRTWWATFLLLLPPLLVHKQWFHPVYRGPVGLSPIPLSLLLWQLLISVKNSKWFWHNLCAIFFCCTDCVKTLWKTDKDHKYSSSTKDWKKWLDNTVGCIGLF